MAGFKNDGKTPDLNGLGVPVNLSAVKPRGQLKRKKAVTFEDTADVWNFREDDDEFVWFDLEDFSVEWNLSTSWLWTPTVGVSGIGFG